MKKLLAIFITLVAAACSAAIQNGRGILCLTFDDPNWPRWEQALPLFEKYGAHASFFPNGPLDDAALASLRRIADAGHTVGPHTFGHADAPAFFKRHGAEKYWELQLKPQMDAFAKVGIHPRSMAYPNNRRTDETDAFLRTKGFRRFRAGCPGVRPYDPKHEKRSALRPLAEIDDVFLPAASVASTAWMRGVGIGEAYNTEIGDVLSALDRAAARNEMIVFFSHNIKPEAKSINMKTEWLERILEHAHSLGMRIVGFDELDSADGSALHGCPPVKALLDGYVDKGRIAGVVSVLSDSTGDVRFDCSGWADIENRIPMRPDTLFAVFSMSKTFNAAAIMVAIDDGRMSLDDEVVKFLPEFADIKVAVTNAAGQPSLVPPSRPLTIRDLVTHTSGSRCSVETTKRSVPLREVARRMAAEPLMAQPGETFCYGNAWVDASAAALEVAVGMPYEQWMRQRILDPLGMKDTTYTPNAEQVSRLVKAYTTDDKPLRAASDRCARQLVFPWQDKVYPAASAGLFSTPADMVRFSQMLAHHGEWNGRRIISRRTFDTVFAVKQTPPGIDKRYCAGAWLYDDWFGHEGAMRTDQRANLKTGHCRVFFIQTENKAGSAFFELKKAWNAMCDKVQGTPPFNPAN